jgi:hypothetical protein
MKMLKVRKNPDSTMLPDIQAIPEEFGIAIA